VPPDQVVGHQRHQENTSISCGLAV
jgi:hypothetical protein